MSTIFRTWLNWPEEGADMEYNDLPSETQPDMVMSLEDMLVRARNGQEIVQFQGSYDDDEQDFTPDPRTLDLVDYDTLMSENKTRIDTLKEKAEGLKKKTKSSVPKQQSDAGATSEGEASQADESASAE